MNGNLPIILQDGSTVGTSKPNCRMDVVETELEVVDELLPVRIGVRNGTAKLADIAPMARELSSKIADVGLRHFKRNGKTIPCRKGCASCCHYIVVLTAPDAFRLVEEVHKMLPQRRKEVKKSFRKANEWFEQHPGKFQRADGAPGSDNLRYPCPFLDNNQCTIYENRPIICREWMVTGTEQNCREDKKVRRLVPSVHIGDVLRQLAARLEDKSCEDVTLPALFEWYSQNIKRSKRVWPAKLVVEQFLEILKNHVSN